MSELRNQYVRHITLKLSFTPTCSWKYFHTIIPSSFLLLKVTLHDMILKNIEKIKRPRSSNTDALYWCSSSHFNLHLPSPPLLLLHLCSSSSSSVSLPWLSSYSNLVLVQRTPSRHSPPSVQSTQPSTETLASIDGHDAHVFVLTVQYFSCFKPFKDINILIDDKKALCIF